MRRVLIIEDNDAVRNNTADILEIEGYKVLKAENGESGVEIAMKENPDIILCDIMMPNMDGFEVLGILGNNYKTKSIPFIFLTAKTERADLRRGMNLGADDFLTKPFEEQELLDALKVRLKKNEFLTREFDRNFEGLNSFVKGAMKYFNIESIKNEYAVKSFGKKEFLYKEGSLAHKLYFIQSGTIKSFRTSNDGKEIVTALYSSGDFIGSLSLLGSSGKYLESASVIDDAEICRIPKEDFMSLLFDNKTVSKRFINLISNNLIELQDKLIHSAFAPVRQRTARTLLELHKNGMISDNDSAGKDMSREDLANIIGTAKETAIRMLSEFKDEGLIATGTNRRIILLNKDELNKIALFR